MKIHLVEDPTPAPQLERTPYTACPLCQGQEWAEARPEGDFEGPPLCVPWQVCETCGHLFAREHTRPDALLGQSQPAPELETLAARRLVAGRVVHRICELRGAIGGLWLEARVGDGALLSAAHEFGYDVLGLDPHEATVERMNQLGLQAAAEDIAALEGEELFDVVSLVGCLERSPFPGQTLASVRRLMRPEGLLFLSLPNVDGALWRELDARGENPHWEREDCAHAFSREHLYWLLRQQGFEPCEFALSELTPVGMDVCAVLAPND